MDRARGHSVRVRHRRSHRKLVPERPSSRTRRPGARGARNAIEVRGPRFDLRGVRRYAIFPGQGLGGYSWGGPEYNPDFQRGWHGIHSVAVAPDPDLGGGRLLRELDLP